MVNISIQGEAIRQHDILVAEREERVGAELEPGASNINTGFDLDLFDGCFGDDIGDTEGTDAGTVVTPL